MSLDDNVVLVSSYQESLKESEVKKDENKDST
jgi:hypothetical protein